jgi:SAM-dependent methyltransferase
VGRTVSTYEYAGVWTGYDRALGVTFSSGVMAANAPELATTLRECRRCGLQYFDPLRPGDQAFYAELMGQVPYVVDRWEFGVVARRAKGAGSAIDLGCGDGAFLERLRAAGVNRIVGVDHNQSAIERLRARGFEGYVGDVADVARDERRSFDVVCLFQTLEHVSDPRKLVAEAASLLSPGGRLFVSVPNRDRLMRAAVDPLDFPPHHVTRWAAGQFAYLAADLGLALESVAFEPPLRWDSHEPRRQRVRQRFARWGPAAVSAVSGIEARLQPPRIWYDVQVRRGAYSRRGLYGHAMLAELRSRASYERDGA